MKCYCCLKENGTQILDVKGTKFILCKKCKKLVKQYVKEIKKARV